MHYYSGLIFVLHLSCLQFFVMSFFRHLLLHINIFIRAYLFSLFKPAQDKRRFINSMKRRLFTDYLVRYLPPEMPEPVVVHDEDISEEKIFTMWLQGEENAPAIVKSCIGRARHFYGDRLIVLDEQSISDYISLPDHIWKKYRSGMIGPAHFTDICRVELLAEYGGCWLDSTCFLTAEIPAEILNAKFFMYLTDDPLLHYDFCLVQNFFIRSAKDSRLLAAWRQMIFTYWEKENIRINYFVHQLLFCTLVTYNKTAAEEFSKCLHLPLGPTHNLWWGHCAEPFDRKRYETLTSGVFFQKTTYKHPQAKNPSPGSFADYLINGWRD